MGLSLAAGCAHSPSAKPAPWVRSLTLHGVEHVEPEALRARLGTEATPRVWGARRRPFDPFVLWLDTRRIESYYKARGYFDARVRATEVLPAGSDGALKVGLFVDEGQATRMAEVKVDGLDAIGDEAQPIIQNFDLRKGQIFDYERYLAEKGELAERLRTLGYAWATVGGEVEVDRDRHEARLQLKVAPGPEVRIHEVIASSNDRLAPRLIVRHSLLRPGQLLTPAAIETARTKLYNLGFLSMVRIDAQPLSARADRADVKVSVIEGPLNEWRLGLGIRFELQRAELGGRAQYTRHRFLGGLRRLRLRAEPAWVFAPTFWRPLRTGPALTLEAELLQYDLALPPDELHLIAGYDLGVEYAFLYQGPRGSVGYGRNFFHDRLQLGVGYGLQYLRFFAVDPALTGDLARSARDYGWVDPYRIAWFEEQLVYDLRDQPLDAHKGLWLSVRAEEGGIYSGSAFSYERLFGELRGYYPLFGRLVVAGRVEFGQLFAQGGYGSPTTRRFALGGPDSHRGFNFGRLAPQIPSGIAGNPALPMGGDQLLLAQVELRIRTARLFGSWLEVAGFVDAGDVAAAGGQPYDRIHLGELHVALGGGLRYKTSFGTFRAELGVRVNRLGSVAADGRPNPDPRQPVAFHLSVGEPF